MLILAFDTTAAACSVALWRDGAVLAAARTLMDRGQAEALMPMIEEAMAAADMSYAHLDRIAVTVGPGSFTGVRVGLAAARGIAMAADKPVVGVTTMEVLADAVPEADGAQILVAIDTKRGDFYAQAFTATKNPIGEIVAVSPEDLTNFTGTWVVTGDGARAAATAIGTQARVSLADPLPDAAILARLAATRPPTTGGPLPLYVHAPAVTMPQGNMT